MNLKDLKKFRKKQLNINQSHEYTYQNLNNLFQEGKVTQFQQIFKELNRKEIICYLFSQCSNSSQIPINKIVESKFNQQYFQLINRNVKQKFNILIEPASKGDILLDNFVYTQSQWQSKLYSLNKFIIKYILNQQSLQKKVYYCKKIVQFIIGSINFLQYIYNHFLNKNFIYNSIPYSKDSTHNILLFLITQFYCPLAQKISVSIFQSVVSIKNSLIKDKIWEKQSFLDAFKQGHHKQMFKLKQMNFNILHYLYTSQKNINKISQIHQFIQKPQNSQYKQFINEFYNEFNSSGKTPTDLLLRGWSDSKNNLSKMWQIIKINQKIRLSINCLNELLSNVNLNQQKKQFFINQIVSPCFIQRGYIGIISRDQVVKNKAIQFSIIQNTNNFYLVYQINQLIKQRDNNNYYPLLAYLSLFRQNSSLKIINLLLPHQFDDQNRLKSKIKKIIKTTIKLFVGQQKYIQKDVQGYKQIQNIMYYHYPLLNIIYHIPQCEVTIYLLKKLFINCPQFYLQSVKKMPKKYQLKLSKHFLVKYYDNISNLDQTYQNKMVLVYIFKSKQTQKFIGQHYNIYIEILKHLNQSKRFRLNQKNYMSIIIRKYLRQQFDKLNQLQMFNQEYLKNMSYYFFQSHQKKQYNPNQDWSLYTIDQIYTKLTKQFKFNLVQIIQKQRKINQLIQSQNITKNNKNFIYLLKLILNYKQNYDIQQDIDISGLDLSAVQSIYKKNRSIKNFNQLLMKMIEDKKHSIKLSIFQDHLQQKIIILINKGFQLNFLNNQLINMSKQLKQPKEVSIKSFYRQINDNLNKNQQVKLKKINIFKRKNLIELSKIMIIQKVSLLESIFYCNKEIFALLIEQILQLNQNILFRNKFIDLFVQKFMSYQNYNYKIKLDHILQTKIFLQKMGLQQKLKIFTSRNIIINIIRNYIISINYIDKKSEAYQNLSLDCSNQQNQNQQDFYDFLTIFKISHKFVRQTYKYCKNEHKLVEYIINRKQTKKQTQIKNVKKITERIIIQQISNKYNSSQNQLNFNQQQSLSYYYEYLKYFLIQNYGSYKNIILFLIKKLSVEQIFICQNKNHEQLLIWKMQSSEQPFRILLQRLKMSKQLIYSTNKKQIQKFNLLFRQQISKFTQNQFIQTIQLIKTQKLIDFYQILKNTYNEDSKIYLFDLIMNDLNQDFTVLKKSLNSYKLNALINQNYLKLFFILTLFIQNDFSLKIKSKNDQGQQFVQIFNKNNLYKKTSNDLFDHHILTNIQKYIINSYSFMRQQKKIKKIQQIINNLLQEQLYERVFKILQIYNKIGVNQWIQQIFKYYSNNQISIKDKSNQLNNLIAKCFSNNDSIQIIQNNQKTFIGAYKLNPINSFSFTITQLKISTIIQCLKSNPQHANLFLINEKIQIIKQDSILNKFPISPYYYDKHKGCKWMLDLIRLQKKLLTTAKKQQYMNQNMENAILIDFMEQNTQLSYTDEQINKKCKHIFSSNNVHSLNKYPKLWLEKYFSDPSNKIKNFQVLSIDLIKQLIQFQSLINQEDFIQILSTCNIELIDLFVNKKNIQANYSFLKKISNNYLDTKHENNLWNYLTIISNQDFLIEFINKYKLLQIYPKQQYQHILLSNIANFRKNKLLSYILRQLKRISTKQLQFVFGQKGIISSDYLIVFPQSIAVQNNYYEYYFLVKQSNNLCPNFYVSNRFLISNNNQLQSISFIPLLYKRLILLDILSKNIPQGNDQSFKMNILMKYTLQLQSIQPIQQIQQSKQEQIKVKRRKSALKKNKQAKKLKYKTLIQYLVNPSAQKLSKLQNFQRILIFYLNLNSLRIKLQFMHKKYPFQVRLLQSVKQYLPKQHNTEKLLKQAIQKDIQLKVLALKYSCQYFMQNISLPYSNQQLSNQLQIVEDPLVYFNAICYNIRYLEKNMDKFVHLQKFLFNICTHKAFVSLNYSQLNQKMIITEIANQNYLLKANLFLMSILSYNEENGRIIKSLKSIHKKQQQENEYFLIYTIQSIHKRQQQNISIPTFNYSCWNFIIDQLIQIQKYKRFIQIRSIKYLKLIDACIRNSIQPLIVFANYKVQGLLIFNKILQNCIKNLQINQSPKIYVYLTIIMNTIKLKQILYEIESFMNKKFKIRFNLNFKFINAQIHNNSYEYINLDGKIIKINIPYEIKQFKRQIPLIFIDFNKLQEQIQLYFQIKNIKQNPTISKITKKYQNIQKSFFKGIKFQYDINCLSKIKSLNGFKKFTEDTFMTNNGVQLIQKYLQNIQKKSFYNLQQNSKFYSLDDVFGPVKLNGQNNKDQVENVLDCLAFYQFLTIPINQIKVQCIQLNPKQIQQQIKKFNLDYQLKDFNKYLQMFGNYVIDYQKPQGYSFENKIKLLLNIETHQITLIPIQCSILNILSVFNLINKYSLYIKRKFQNNLQIKFNIRDIVKVYQEVCINLKQQISNKQNSNKQISNKQISGISLIEFINLFISNSQHLKLLDSLIFLIIQDAINIMTHIKCILMNYKICKNHNDTKDNNNNYQTQRKILFIFKNIAVFKIQYEIIEQILHIKFILLINSQQNRSITLNKQKQIKKQQNQSQFNKLINRRDFLQSTFKTTQVLTDYFIKKSILTNKCILISRHLSKRFNKTINLHIDYEQLYKKMNILMNELSIKQIDGYLQNLSNYIIEQLQFQIMKDKNIFVRQFLSSYNVNNHQVQLLNMFEYLCWKLNQQNKSNQIIKSNITFDQINQSITFDQINQRKQLVYYLQQQKNNKGIKLISNILSRVQNIDNDISNVFFIQIYKNIFNNIVIEGMTFLIGYKAIDRNPKIIKFLKRSDIDKINISQIQYIMLILPYIPTNDQLNHNKIIRVFLSDFSYNIYQLQDKLLKYFYGLNQENSYQRNLKQIFSSIPNNILIKFKNSIDTNKVQNELMNQIYKKQVNEKTFQIQLNNNSSQFKLKPYENVPISIINKLKINHNLSILINQLIKNMKENIINQDFSLKISIQQQQLPLNTIIEDLVEVIRIGLMDIQTSLKALLQNQIDSILRNSQFQSCYSLSQNVNILQNSYLQKRKILFKQCFNTVQIKINNNNKKPQLKLLNKSIVYQINLNGHNKFIMKDCLIRQLIIYFIKQQIQKRKYFIDVDINKIYFDKLTINNLLILLDFINFSQFQLKQINNAFKLFKLLNKEQIKNYYNDHNFKIKVSLEQKTQLININKTILLNFNPVTQKIQFYQSASILTLLLNKFNKIEQQQKFQTYFDNDTNQINLLNYKNHQTILMILKDKKKLIFDKFIINNLKTVQSNMKLIYCDKLAEQVEDYSSCQFWIIDTNSNICSSNYMYSKLQIKRKIKQNSQKVRIDQPIYMYLHTDKAINLNNKRLLSITTYLYSENQHKNKFESIFNSIYHKNIQLKMLSKQTIQIRFKFTFSTKLSLHLNKGYSNLFALNQKDKFQIIVSSDKNYVIENTRFVQLQYRNKLKIFNINNKDMKNKNNNLFFQPGEIYTIDDQNINKVKQNNQIQSLVYVVSKQNQKFLTRAGQQRIDYIQICDAEHNAIQYKQQLNIVFIHSNHLCKITPQIIRKQLKIGLKWSPTIRGSYKIFLNNICLSPQYQIGVAAAQIDISKTIVQTPKVTKLSFGEQSECTFYFKDTYNNIYTQLQQNIIGDKLLIEFLIVNHQTTQYNINKNSSEMINKYGIKIVKFTLNSIKAIDKKNLQIAILINKQKIKQFQLQLQGLSLNNRKKNLQRQITNKIIKGHKRTIEVSRSKFLQDLFEITNRDMKTDYFVKFIGQQGIDAGGVKRQFYDLIGSEMKSQQNPFFKAIDKNKNNYFFKPQILKNKKKQDYMVLFGKLLANSIINNQLVGINFSSVFIKLLYGQNISFDDLLQILPEQQSTSYKFMLEADQQELQDLCVFFVVVKDKKKGIQMQLKQNGKNIQVTKQNVKEYLQLLTHYFITQRYQCLIKNFISGFQTVIQINFIKQFIKTHQFWCLTQGAKQINADVVLNNINFKGIKIQALKSWFSRYIKQASLQILQGFLKFTTGSSTIDYYQTQKIVVTFENNSNSHKLPISHTCWKQIVIPQYKSYEIMHKLLNAAFLFCSQGFGFG